MFSNDEEASMPLADRFDKTLVYASFTVFYGETEETTEYLNNKLIGLNDRGCSWTSKQSER